MQKLNTPKVLINVSRSAFFTCLLIWGISSCSFAEQKQEQSIQNNFTLPSIPDSLKAPKDRANYLTLHYWDNFNFSDTSYIHLPEISEQAFIDFIVILPHAEYKYTTTSINKILSLSETEESGRMYQYILGLFEKYLYDPNSPYRNDEYYIPVAEYILNDHRSNEAERMRTQYRLKMMYKNRVGEIANDFVYTLANKSTGRLYEIKTPYTLLYFNNPDCHACAEINTLLKGLPIINKLLSDDTLSILAFYPDKDTTAWKKHLSDTPDGWINGYDKNTDVENDQLYDLKAIPSLYLLDKDKRVILKDVDFNILNQWFENEFAHLFSSNQAVQSY